MGYIYIYTDVVYGDIQYVYIYIHPIAPLYIYIHPYDMLHVWNVYQHLHPNSGPHVGKYSMLHMGYVQ